jgi:hypothetical protein
MLIPEMLIPSTVLSSMVEGLKKSKDDPLFKVDMYTLGEVRNGICYGGCSEVTLAELYGEGALVSELILRSQEVNKLSNLPEWCTYASLSNVLSVPLRLPSFLNIDLRSLETVVYEAGRGSVSPLIKLLTGEVNESFNGRWHLKEDDWEKQLPIIQETIIEMIPAYL